MEGVSGGRGAGKRRGRPARPEHGDGEGRAARRERTPRKSVAERLESGELTIEEAVELARETVLRVLTAAPKSRRELEQSLGRKGYPEHVVTPVLDRFDEVGLVDDAEYAQMVVRTRHGERGLARRAIAMELRRRGIDDDTAVEALEQVDDEDERVTAEQLAHKLVARTRGLDRDVRVRRAAAALARKGYGPGLAFGVVKDALAAEGEEMDDLPEYG
ncbi:regulatory protein RecX [Xylanimonas cellulosilytica DSM 15894]|uniref:Regulatory protein RecX n=1 Tax=Xylanimonas cellulosilytica (strain DSM 15894 / JCM 12276 / CECT 5975 / KCTC 9989 / LMG 20990 / NBRC 107835 / XIL07) TaxID=446471 RepID=D1C085_XYLCX|nr:regulatory protein RecX [Xylanimonas cellulosilytica]ACZ30274.1 regulatory protein RecX [Xylanimonas cellulosilytica DSM 15894]